MPFNEFKAYMNNAGVKNSVFKELPGYDHEYNELDTINDLIRDYLANPKIN